MISISVKVTSARRGRRAPRRQASLIAKAWASEVDTRVLRGGRPEGGRPSYADHGRVLTPAGYAAGGSRLVNGADLHRSSAALRARGYANASSGMRRGLIVRQGTTRAVVEFAGSSVGANIVWVDGRATAATVSNAEKARTVLEAHGRNVLEVSEADLRAIRDAAEEWARRSVGAALGGRIRWTRRNRGERSSLARRLLREN